LEHIKTFWFRSDNLLRYRNVCTSVLVSLTLLDTACRLCQICPPCVLTVLELDDILHLFLTLDALAQSEAKNINIGHHYRVHRQLGLLYRYTLYTGAAAVFMTHGIHKDLRRVESDGGV
jgi:hypothetical protein